MSERAAGRWLPVLAVLLLGLLLSMGLGLKQQADNRERIDAALQRKSEDLAAWLAQQINRYAYGLRGTRGAIVALGDAALTRESFARYQRTRDIPSEFPGAHGFGFVRWVPHQQLAAFTRQARADGMPDFAVQQLQAHQGAHYVIQYIEPLADNRAAVGLDVASEPLRKQAADQAASTGQAQLTAPLTLVQASGLPRQGLLLLLPIYSASAPTATPDQRRAALMGWSYAPLVLDEVLAQFDFDHALFELALFDTGAVPADQPFFNTASGLSSTGLSATFRQTLFGRTWQLRLTPKPAFYAELRLTPPIQVVALGSGASVLLAALVLMRQLGGQRQRHALAAQTRLATMVENSGDAIINESLEGRVTGWNHAAEQIFGWTAAEALGRPLSELIGTPDHADETRMILQRAAGGEVLHPFDSVRRRRDGSQLDVSIAASAITDGSGHVIGVGKSLRDISGRRAQVRSLQEFNQALEQQVGERTRQLDAIRHHLRTILDALPSMVGYWDHNLVNRFANRAYHDWFGVNPESLPGRVMSDLLSPALMAHNRPYIDAVLAGRPQTFERAIPGPNGVVRHSLAHYLPDVIDGQVKGFYVLVHDVTELTLNRQRLADSEAVLNRTGGIARIGGWQYELPGGVITWTHQTRVIHEVDDNYQPSLETALAFFPPGDRERVARAVDQALADGTPWDMELQLVTAKGQVLWVRSQGELEWGPEALGRPVQRLVGSIQDITDRRKADQALQRVQAAEAANAAKSAFLANISHEMRTPLNAVIGFAHILSQGRLEADQRQLMARIHDAGRQLLGIINNVLDLSKIEAGQMPLSPAPFALAPLLQQAADMLGQAAQDKHLDLRLHTSPDLPAHCLGDEMRVRQIVTNLLANAIKFTDTGYIVLVAEPLPKLGHLPWVRLIVQDTGMGIAPEAQQRLFEPFSQADESDSRRFGGTGLGLSIVRHLAVMMGGQVGLHSQPGLGSRFWVDLPLPAADGAEARWPASVPGHRASTLPNSRLQRLPGVRLLVVDDSALNLEVAQRILEAEGALVQTACQASEALVMLLSPTSQIELVVMDVQMPDLDGLEATRRLRQHQATRALPVVALSAGALVSDRNSALAAGLNAFVSKPFHPDELVLTVRDEVARSRGQPIVPLARPDHNPASPWPQLSGIDAGQARALLVDDLPAFVRLLGQLLAQPLPEWAAHQPPSGADLRALQQCTHRWQGSAAVLGAVDLLAACRQLHSVLHALPVNAQALPLALQQVRASVDVLQAQWPALALAHGGLTVRPDGPAALQPSDNARLADWARLQALLQAQDLAALTLYRQLAPALADRLGPLQAQALDLAMARLDFATAQALCPSA